MGWTSFYTDYKTNKESFLHEVLHDKTQEVDKDGKLIQKYLGVSQRGSDIFLLGQNADGEYWIDLFLCRREDGQFYYKGMRAIDNAKAGSIPKKWVALLDQNDESVKEYLARSEKEASKGKVKIGDILKCTNGYGDIVWGNGYRTVKENADFYVRVELKNPYAKRQSKIYRLLDKTDNGYRDTNCRVMEKTIKNLPNVEIVK